MKRLSLILTVIFFVASISSCKNLKEDKDNDGIDSTDIVYSDENYEHFNADTAAMGDNNLDTALVIVKDTANTVKDTVKIEPVMAENNDGSLKKVSEDEMKKEQKKNVKKEHIKKFYIVAGSFKEMKNAIRLRSFFKSKGYPAMVLYPEHSYNRVATGSYPNRATAEKDIKKFRSMNLIYEKEKIEYWLLWR